MSGCRLWSLALCHGYAPRDCAIKRPFATTTLTLDLTPVSISRAPPPPPPPPVQLRICHAGAQDGGGITVAPRERRRPHCPPLPRRCTLDRPLRSTAHLGSVCGGLQEPHLRRRAHRPPLHLLTGYILKTLSLVAGMEAGMEAGMNQEWKEWKGW